MFTAAASSSCQPPVHAGEAHLQAIVHVMGGYLRHVLVAAAATQQQQQQQHSRSAASDTRVSIWSMGSITDQLIDTLTML
jgi:hypothetical protein